MTAPVQVAIELTEEQRAVVVGAMQQVDHAFNPDIRRRDFFVAIVTCDRFGNPQVLATGDQSVYKPIFRHIADATVEASETIESGEM